MWRACGHSARHWRSSRWPWQAAAAAATTRAGAPTPARPPRSRRRRRRARAAARQAAAGKEVFTSNCAGCHTLADAGTNGTQGPNLDELKPSEVHVQSQVTNGGGGMPAFGDRLSEEQIQAVAAYVSSVAGQ